MHTVFALLCFVVVIHWLIFPYPSGLLHWHCGNLTIAPVPAKQPWWIWINTSCEFIMNDCITTTKQSTTKPCAYFLGYTVLCWVDDRIVSWSVAYYALSDRRCMEISSAILTHKRLDIFSKMQFFSDVILHRCNISVWNLSNTINCYSALCCWWPGALAPGQQ